ncbi:hypothetical protein PC117_g26538 [Phytophthora cactorum]|uniref:Uncharacterized protein n=1 Tax=Phytophthora cactorum TaxID=29920 RepID=A0A8T1AEN2_9STRA|nr:hypothetical protein PC117_g26538 [Phytophthora cactorum]
MWMWPFPFECVHCRNTAAGVDATCKLEGYRKCEEAVREEWEHYRQKNAVGTGSLRPTFELGPMIGQMDENPLSVSLGDTVTTFVRDNVTFSRVVVNEYEDPSNIEDETSWQLAFGHQGKRAQVESTTLIGAIEQGILEEACLWLFSKRARTCSSLQSLVLESAGESAGRCVFSHADAEAFCAEALSEYPEEERSAVELTVLTFSDDGESEWVNVVAPGYG